MESMTLKLTFKGNGMTYQEASITSAVHPKESARPHELEGGSPLGPK